MSTATVRRSGSHTHIAISAFVLHTTQPRKRFSTSYRLPLFFAIFNLFVLKERERSCEGIIWNKEKYVLFIHSVVNDEVKIVAIVRVSEEVHRVKRFLRLSSSKSHNLINGKFLGMFSSMSQQRSYRYRRFPLQCGSIRVEHRNSLLARP